MPNEQAVENVTFSSPSILAALDDMAVEQLDDMAFGVIRMDTAGLVTAYNLPESKFSGLSPSRVIGRHFFSSVGQCMNNFMVSDRYETEAALDETLNYILTLRVRRTPVRLRLLKGPTSLNMYLLVERKTGI